MPISGIGSAAADDAVAGLVAALTSVQTILPGVASYTYNADGSIATETVSGATTTFTYNSDGTVATMTRSGVTRTFAYNADGSIASVT